jgi:hypothetical protein
MTQRSRLLPLVAATVAATACGGSARSPTRTTPGVPAAAVRVVVGWSKALRAGDIATAARFFRVPSTFFDGSSAPVELHSVSEIEEVNAALPCGAVFVSAHARGPYLNVLFRLTERDGPGGGAACGAGVGQTARTNFVIRRGRIVAWLRAPDEPGDNGTPRTTPTPHTTPATTATTPAQV